MTIHPVPVLRRSPIRAAFTLVEAVVAIALTAIAGAALLLGVSSSMQTTHTALEQAIAAGMAQQLIDEVAGARYMEYGLSPYDTVLQPGSDEKATGNRRLFDDIDDFNGFQSQPPVDAWGVSLGEDDWQRSERYGQPMRRHHALCAPEGFFARWRREIAVYYVDPSDLTTRLASGQVSDYRAIEVRIIRVDPHRGPRELARLRRVVAHVPPL